MPMRLRKVRPLIEIEIVKRSDVRSAALWSLPKRWIVERTIAWLNRCRRLANEIGECLNRKALAFLRLASIRLMLRKLCNPAWKSPGQNSKKELTKSQLNAILAEAAANMARLLR